MLVIKQVIFHIQTHTHTQKKERHDCSNNATKDGPFA